MTRKNDKQPIVCGTDFSAVASEAVDIAAAMARRLETKLVLVHVDQLLGALVSNPVVLEAAILQRLVGECTARPFTSPHRIGLNSVLLHRGHLPAVSNGTGVVKCFIYRHSLHFHAIKRFSCACSIWFNAFITMSRIARLAFSVLSVVSINPIPSAEVSRSACAIYVPKGGVIVLSCSNEHIELRSAVQNKTRCALGGHGAQIIRLRCLSAVHLSVAKKIEMARSVRQKRAKRLLKHRLARSEGIPMGVDATNLGECLQAYYPVFSA
jgi:hypothetical protein